MKNPYPDIHPTMDDEEIRTKISNWEYVNDWFKENPHLDNLKRACVVEARTRKRLTIINRLLGRVMKLEKVRISEALMS